MTESGYYFVDLMIFGSQPGGSPAPHAVGQKFFVLLQRIVFGIKEIFYVVEDDGGFLGLERRNSNESKEKEEK